MVLSIAIREGVARSLEMKSLEMTAGHFVEGCGKKARFFIYNSRRLHEPESFSSDAGINVMVINGQTFNGTGADNRRIHEELDDFQSRRPIDVIARNRPGPVVAQGVVVVQVLVTQGQAVDPLPQHIPQTVLNLARLPVVGQPPGKRCRQSRQVIRPAQQQNAAVARHMTSIEAGGYPAFTTGWKFQLIGGTICHR